MDKRPPQLWQLNTALWVLRVIVIGVMFLLTLDWALGEGSHRAWLAVFGLVLTLLEILDRRTCD